jgi:hypothetical protein
MKIFWLRFLLGDPEGIKWTIDAYACLPKQERIKKIRSVCKLSSGDKKFVMDYMPEFYQEAGGKF